MPNYRHFKLQYRLAWQGQPTGAIVAQILWEYHFLTVSKSFSGANALLAPLADEEPNRQVIGLRRKYYAAKWT